MNCKIDGCDRVAMYKSEQVCQKHYFRMMRNGTYDLVEKNRKPEIITPNGYRKIFKPNFELSNSDGYVFEHRYVFFNENKGKNLNCEFCGKAWSFRPYKDHVDHIDEDRLNNDISNLRPLCNGCNVKRTKINYHDLSRCSSVSWLGETKTYEAWGRDERTIVDGRTLRNRIKAGWELEKAMTKPLRKRKDN